MQVNKSPRTHHLIKYKYNKYSEVGIENRQHLNIYALIYCKMVFF